MLLNYKLPENLLSETSKKDKIISIRVNQETNEILENICKTNNRSKAEIIRIALKNLIK